MKYLITIENNILGTVTSNVTLDHSDFILQLVMKLKADPGLKDISYTSQDEASGLTHVTVFKAPKGQND